MRRRASLAAVALVVAVVYFLPLHVSQTTSGETTMLVGEVAADATGILPRQIALEIELVSGGPLVVEQIHNEDNVNFVVPPAEGWAVVENGIGTASTGSSIVIDSSVRHLNVVLRSVEGAPSTVRVSSDGTTNREIDLQGVEPVSVQIASGASVETTTRRFGFRSVTLPAETATETPTQTETRAWLGPVPLEVRESTDGGDVVVPAGSTLLAILTGLWSVTNVIVVAVLLVLSFLAFGWAALGRSFDETDPYLAVALGAALPALLLGAINYLLPVRVAVPVVVVAMIGLLWWRWRASGDPVVVAIDSFRSLVARSSIGGPLALSAVFVGLPAAFTHNSNLGMLQTDIFNYINVQRTYWSSNIVESGLDWGDGLRSIDSTARSAVVGWTHLSTMEGFTAVRFMTIAVALITVGGACRSLGARAHVVGFVQLAMVSMASINSLWVEGYLSREMFIWIVIPTVAVSMRILGEPAANRGGNWLALGVIFAWPAALVPPFMVTLLTPAIGLLAMSRSDGLSVARRQGLFFSAGFLAGLVPNSRWIFDFAKANEYAQGVEYIGKQFVVPFYDDPEFPAAALGLTGFHTNPISWQGPKTLDGIGGPLSLMLRGSNALASTWTASLVALTVLLVASVMMWHQAEPANRPRIVALLGTAWSVVLAVPFLIDTSWETQSFFVLMWVWTMAGLLLTPILIGASSLRGRSGAVVGLAVGGLMLVNLASSTLEMTMWLSHPQAEGASYHHYDTAADVLAIRQLVDQKELGLVDFRIEEPLSVTNVNNDDRVLYNHLTLALERDGASCLNCLWDTRNDSVYATDPALAVSTDRVLVIGANHCLTGQPLYEGVLVALCQHGQSVETDLESAVSDG